MSATTYKKQYPNRIYMQMMDGLVVGGLNDCWEWGKIIDGGYGIIFDSINRKNILVHRAMLDFIGKGEPDKHTDHLCKNKKCSNPRHLEHVDIKTNVLRGDGITARNLKKQFCSKGHKFDADNTYWYINKNGYYARGCRICRRNNRRAFYAKGRLNDGL